jgi:hypothetical protein
MTDNPLDSRREKLIALLYGELDAAEERWLREEIERDAALRSDFEELCATRQMLQKWEVAEQPPSFVFVDDQETAKQESAKAEVRSGILGGWLDRLRGLAPATSWVFATAAIAVVALALTDFQVRKSNGGWSVGFGTPPVQRVALGDVDDLDGAVPLEPTLGENRGTAEMVSAGDQGLSPGSGPYITREEFEAYNIGMTRTMIALLNEYDRQREQETNAFLRTAFGGVAERQQEDYRDLRNRIEALTVGMSEEQYRTGVQIDYLMQHSQPGLVAPTSDTTAGGRKE